LIYIVLPEEVQYYFANGCIILNWSRTCIVYMLLQEVHQKTHISYDRPFLSKKLFMLSIF